MKYVKILMPVIAGFVSLQAVQAPRALVSPVPNTVILPGVQETPYRAKDLTQKIQFWVPQFIEHMQYAEVAFEHNPLLHRKAVKFAKLLMEFQDKLNKDPKSRALLQTYRNMLDHMLRFQEKGLQVVQKRKLGKALEDLLTHMNEELEYHRDDVNGKKRTLAEEKGFWARHDKEVATLDAYKPLTNSFESKVLAKLKSMGLKEHEAREDAYAEGQLSRKSSTRNTHR